MIDGQVTIPDAPELILAIGHDMADPAARFGAEPRACPKAQTRQL